MTKAYAYLRVSGMGQMAEGKDGLTRQRDAIDRYSLTKGLEIVQEFVDGGVSGKTELENRLGLAACLEAVESGDAKVVICEDASRLARDAMVSEIIVRQFQRSGGVILTASGVNLTEGDDSNPTAALIRGVLALVAEFDRRITVLKLRAARNRKKAKTGRCEGRKPFGTTPAERRALEQMQSYRLSGRTCAEIAVLLNDTGFPTRFGKRWHPGTVSKILAAKSCTSDSSTTTHDEVSQ